MLKNQIQSEMKTAMKSGDKRRLGVIRLMLAAIKQREIDERIELDDTQVLVVLDKMTKQRRDSITQYESAGRNELAEQEAFEIEIIKEFLPEALSEAEVLSLVKEAVASSGASSIRDMGKVMGLLKPKIQGRADMGMVSAIVKKQIGA